MITDKQVYWCKYFIVVSAFIVTLGMLVVLHLGHIRFQILEKRVSDLENKKFEQLHTQPINVTDNP